MVCRNRNIVCPKALEESPSAEAQSADSAWLEGQRLLPKLPSWPFEGQGPA